MSYSQALEEQIGLLRFLESQDFREYERQEVAEKRRLGMDDEFNIGNYELVRQALVNADPYYWDASIVRAIEVSATSLPETRLLIDMLPTPAGFWWFASPLTAGTTLHRQEVQFRGLGWTPIQQGGRDGIGFYPVYQWPDSPGMRRIRVGILAAWGFGRSWEEVYAGVKRLSQHNALTDLLMTDREVILEDHVRVMRLFMTGLLFIQQRILVTADERPGRHVRKRLEREGFTHEPLIRVVELRRKQARSEHHGDSEPVEWSHQWIVSGHWRQQWYPSLNANQPRWIMPYIKGPPDRPLKPPRAKVFAVVR